MSRLIFTKQSMSKMQHLTARITLLDVWKLHIPTSPLIHTNTKFTAATYIIQSLQFTQTLQSGSLGYSQRQENLNGKGWHLQFRCINPCRLTDLCVIVCQLSDPLLLTLYSYKYLMLRKDKRGELISGFESDFSESHLDLTIWDFILNWNPTCQCQNWSVCAFSCFVSVCRRVSTGIEG